MSWVMKLFFACGKEAIELTHSYSITSSECGQTCSKWLFIYRQASTETSNCK